MNIAFSFNDKYYRYVYVAMTSVIKNNPQEMTFYLMHTDVTSEHQAEINALQEQYDVKVEWIYIDPARFPSVCPTNVQWTLEAYYRLLLGEVLPKTVNRILYLDADIIVNKSLQELYEMDFDGMELIACEDANQAPFGDQRDEIFKEFEDKSYVCSGVILFNIEAIRRKYTFEDYMGVAKKFDFDLMAPDQDIINYLHHGKIKILDSKIYNMYAKYYYRFGVDLQKAREDVVIIHYTGWKPWDGQAVHYSTEIIWWEYAKETPYYMAFLEEFQKNAIMVPMVYDTIQKQFEEKKELYAALQKSQDLCEKLYNMISSK